MSIYLGHHLTLPQIRANVKEDCGADSCNNGRHKLGQLISGSLEPGQIPRQVGEHLRGCLCDRANTYSHSRYKFWFIINGLCHLFHLTYCVSHLFLCFIKGNLRGWLFHLIKASYKLILLWIIGDLHREEWFPGYIATCCIVATCWIQ